MLIILLLLGRYQYKVTFSVVDLAVFLLVSSEYAFLFFWIKFWAASRFSFALFLTLTVLQGVMVLITQSSLVTKSLYVMSGLSKFS